MKVCLRFRSLKCEEVRVVIRMGRWSDVSFVMVFQVVFFAVWLLASDMSGEEFCWLWAVGRRVGELVLSVV